MKNMKIGTRLGLGFGALNLLILLMAVLGILRLENINDANRHLVDEAWTKETAAQAWLLGASVNAARSLALVKSDDEATQTFLQQHIAAQNQDIDKNQQFLEKNISSNEERMLFAKVMELREVYRGIRSSIFALKKVGAVAEANAQILTRLYPALHTYVDGVQAVLDHYSRGIETSEQSISADYELGRTLLMVVAALAILTGMVTSWRLTSGITHPLHEAVRLAEAVADGDLVTRSTQPARGDETGMLLTALARMQSQLRNVVGKIRQGTDSIATASDEIARGNLDLSTRTEQQASSLTETASSMEELTSTVRQNAENSHQAKHLAVSASDVVAKGGAVMSDVVNTMHDINSSAQKIEDIIDVIDGIAFQTNILALNAAVEAARAGEQGRGFAVVASEVRNLAQRSATAAKEIKVLIDNSMEKVDVGSKLVVQAGSTMDEIVVGVKRVAEIMAEITNASQEQSDGIGQINQAVIQMDQVTQQNAALVEQAAAAAGALQAQAQAVAQAVSVFRIGQDTQPKLCANGAVANGGPAARVRKPAGTMVVAKAAAVKATAAQSDDWEAF